MEDYQEQPVEEISWMAQLLGRIVEAELLFARAGEVAIPINLPESSQARLSLRDWFDLRILKTVPFKDELHRPISQ